MNYKMFIDDGRTPDFLSRSGFVRSSYIDMVVVRSSAAAISMMEELGVPSFISFDHDLGGDDTARRVVNWMMNALMDEKIVLPDDFDFFVHSQNPVGAKWIVDMMTGLIMEFGKEN